MGKFSYTKEVAKLVREVKPPYPGIVFDIVDRIDFVTIRLREDIIMAYSDEKQVTVMEYLQKVRNVIEACGIRCEFEGLKYRG